MLLLLSPVLVPPLLIAARALDLDEDDIEGNNCVWNLRARSIDQKLHEAEQRRVFVGETGVVIVHLIPETLGGQTDSLSIHLSDNTLNNNFVAWHVETLNGRSNLVDDVFRLFLGVHGIVVLALEVELNDVLNDFVNSRGVESRTNKR